ncbi:MAG: 3-phosphoshikimate 1-carboxyvinyltransferase [Prevotellaceae bacterium]|jgi:3-phosphoshikimate 1-carboxyvinyltransferase|nr:3-phosphoshikimate 1-carboxyvinyltransferase [Prevotellaceae bacterium]
MKKSVKSSAVNGTIVAPASKSVAQRAIVAAVLCQGTSTLRNLSLCNDTSAALGVARTLGAIVEQHGNDYTISSDFFAKNIAEKKLFCGESGLLTRMITPVAALLSHYTEINGHGSLLKRPVDMVENPLRGLGATIVTDRSLLPITVKGPLKGGEISIDGSISSQLLTGLLMALPLAQGNSTIHVSNLKSKPYIDITIDLLKSFGVEIINDSYEIFRIKGHQKFAPCTCSIEGDWSGASCPLVAGAIAGNITVENLDENSAQADKEILTVLERAGAKISAERTKSSLSSISVSKGNLQAFTFDATHCPDLFPAIVALASQCNGISQIYGAERLTHKESNRALTLRQEFATLGIKIDLSGNEMRVAGGQVTGGSVNAHNDHRIAMALATAALCANGEVIVDEAESVDKSYSKFWDDLAVLTSGQ